MLLQPLDDVLERPKGVEKGAWRDDRDAMPKPGGEVAEVSRHEELRPGRHGDLEEGLVGGIGEAPRQALGSKRCDDFLAVTLDLPSRRATSAGSKRNCGRASTS